MMVKKFIQSKVTVFFKFFSLLVTNGISLDSLESSFWNYSVESIFDDIAYCLVLLLALDNIRALLHVSKPFRNSSR